VLWSLTASFLLLVIVLAAILSLFPAIRGHWMITALMLLAILLLFAMLFMSFDPKAAAGRSYTRPQGESGGA
jgi:hypothetical protein